MYPRPQLSVMALRSRIPVINTGPHELESVRFDVSQHNHRKENGYSQWPVITQISRRTSLAESGSQEESLDIQIDPSIPGCGPSMVRPRDPAPEAKRTVSYPEART